jgi:hypothetical protein
MSGNRDFDPVRFLALADYIHLRRPCRKPEELAWLMFHSDFGAYRHLGASLTGATYLKGEVYPEVREAPDFFPRFLAARRRPLWLRALGLAVAFYAIRGGIVRGSKIEA